VQPLVPQGSSCVRLRCHEQNFVAAQCAPLTLTVVTTIPLLPAHTHTVCLSVCLSVCLFVSFVCLDIRRSRCPSARVCMYVCVCVCVCISALAAHAVRVLSLVRVGSIRLRRRPRWTRACECGTDNDPILQFRAARTPKRIDRTQLVLTASCDILSLCGRVASCRVVSRGSLTAARRVNRRNRYSLP